LPFAIDISLSKKEETGETLEGERGGGPHRREDDEADVGLEQPDVSGSLHEHARRVVPDDREETGERRVAELQPEERVCEGQDHHQAAACHHLA
jgi:hypothetical protein